MDSNIWNDLLDGDPRGNPADAVPFSNTLANVHGQHRPWPPVMVRDFIRANNAAAMDVAPTTQLADIADFLAADSDSIIAVRDDLGYLMGVCVDHDVMALIKRDGVKALDYPVVEALQCERPICSVTDSPYVVAAQMRAYEWDRFGVSDRGHIVGVIARHDLADFFLD